MGGRGGRVVEIGHTFGHVGARLFPKPLPDSSNNTTTALFLARPRPPPKPLCLSDRPTKNVRNVARASSSVRIAPFARSHRRVVRRASARRSRPALASAICFVRILRLCAHRHHLSRPGAGPDVRQGQSERPRLVEGVQHPDVRVMPPYSDVSLFVAAPNADPTDPRAWGSSAHQYIFFC